MTQSEWLASEDPAAMLRLVDRNLSKFGTSDRKLRLFACACCRAVWHHLADPRSRNAVEVAERYADELTAANERGKAFNTTDMVRGYEGVLARGCLRARAAEGALEIVREPHDHEGRIPAAHAALLRDIVGDPFRPVTIVWRTEGPYGIVAPKPVGDRMGCTLIIGQTHYRFARYVTPQVLALAQAAYDQRDRKCLACNRWTDCEWCDNTRRLPTHDGSLDNARLAVLSDALEEAGCPAEERRACAACDGKGGEPLDTGGTTPWGDSVDSWHVCDECGGVGVPSVPHPLLSHLRSAGPHVRGCWALDLIVGKH